MSRPLKTQSDMLGLAQRPPGQLDLAAVAALADPFSRETKGRKR